MHNRFSVSAVDLHVHSSPCIFARKTSDLNVAEYAAARGFKAIVLKAHHGDTVGRARAVTEAMQGKIQVFGGVVLNHFVGGFNLFAVEGALKTGARMVWMPTIHALNHLQTYGSAGYNIMEQEGDKKRRVAGLSVFNSKQKIKINVLEILSLVAEANACVATGHLGRDEIFALCRAAREQKVKRVLVNHPDMETLRLSSEEQFELARTGIFLEKTFLPLTPAWGGGDIKELACTIHSASPARCVIASDLGQPGNPMPADGFSTFLSALAEEGFSEEELSLMAGDNPSFLLGLDP